MVLGNVNNAGLHRRVKIERGLVGDREACVIARSTGPARRCRYVRPHRHNGNRSDRSPRFRRNSRLRQALERHPREQGRVRFARTTHPGDGGVLDIHQRAPRLDRVNDGAARQAVWQVGDYPRRTAKSARLGRDLQLRSTLAAKSGNRSRLTRYLPPKDLARKVSRRLLMIQALATRFSVAHT
jgi:hypothetical protein